MYWCLLILLIPSVVKAQTNKNAFVVSLHEHYMKVVSPGIEAKKDKKLNVIIENKTVSKIIGRLDQGDKAIYYLTLPPNSFKTFEYENIESQQVSFIPMAPALQEAPLIIGQKQYAIPPQK